MRKGKVQVKTIDGRSRWLEPRDVKEKLTLVYENEDEEDSSTDTSEDQGQKNLGGEDFDAESSDEDIDYRQRSKSTYIGDGDREDVYTQLREEWDVGSIVETWSEGCSRWVVGQIIAFETVDGYQEETCIVLYRIENEDGSITTISKRVLVSSHNIRPFVNKLSGTQESGDQLKTEHEYLLQKTQELQETNDEFLLTIDHQSQTMEQLQSICQEMTEEKEELQEQIVDLESTIHQQSEIIESLMAQMQEESDGDDS